MKTTRKSNKGDEYIPALKFDWLTPFFDPLLKWVLREASFKNRLIKQARIQKRHKILDLGCGTGTLTLQVKRAHPHSKVFGLDGDPKILRIAEAKADKADVDLILDHGMSFKLPYPDNSFDRVLSSLLFHHLTRENKTKTLKEVFRVLRPGGELHVADWGEAQNRLMRALFFSIQLLDGFESTTDNVEGFLPELFQKAGLNSVKETSRFSTIFGTLSLYEGEKPRR